MAELVQQKENQLASAYDRVEKRLNEGAPPWLRELREKGIAFFREHGLPHPKNEAWRSTKLDALRKTAYAPVTDADVHSVTAEDLKDFTFPDTTGSRLVFINGHHAEHLSHVGDLPDGVTVTTLKKAIADGNKTVEEHLGKSAIFEKEEHTFTALNTALLQDGAFIHVPRNAVLDQPVHVLYVTTRTDEPTMTAPRTLVIADESAEATFLESFFSLEDGDYFTNAVAEVYAADNAKVDHIRLQRESEQAHHISDNQFTEARDTVVRTLNVDLGADTTRNNTVATLNGEGGDLQMNGLFAPHGTQHVDNHTRIEHVAPHCTSHELYKGILDGKSRGVFTGLIHVHNPAQQTDAIQHNPNLILTDGALVDSKPQLEIYADDVKCTHGSTIGQLEAESIFYLTSRGIDKETARTLLTYAFAGEVIDDVKYEPVREKLKELLLQRLPNGDRVREVV